MFSDKSDICFSIFTPWLSFGGEFSPDGVLTDRRITTRAEGIFPFHLNWPNHMTLHLENSSTVDRIASAVIISLTFAACWCIFLFVRSVECSSVLECEGLVTEHVRLMARTGELDAWPAYTSSIHFLNSLLVSAFAAGCVAMKQSTLWRNSGRISSFDLPSAFAACSPGSSAAMAASTYWLSPIAAMCSTKARASL
jgi:hypothetical protein